MDKFSFLLAVWYEITAKAKVVVEIYTINGQKIKQLVDSEMPVGKHSIPWNACNDNNSQVEPGVYVCRMLVGNKAELSRQMLMVK